MAILTGRYGQVAYSSIAGGIAGSPETADPIISLNTWTLDSKADYEDVSCFQDLNKVYVPGLIDAGGTLGGFWNSADTKLWTAAASSTPGFLMLTPNTTDSTLSPAPTPLDTPFWSGLAYLDASINCSLTAPKVTGTWKAAGTFSLHPVGA